MLIKCEKAYRIEDLFYIHQPAADEVYIYILYKQMKYISVYIYISVDIYITDEIYVYKILYAHI